MGLLDFSGFVGDDTVKDEYGMTQADRRQPLFSGLLKAGLLGMAAGDNITPGQRAQLLGQMGGAITDIPTAMMQQRTQGAQQILQQQQIKAGQAKLGTAERLAALAKSPEFQAAVARLEPEERLLLQAALDAGDMAHAQQILSGAQRARTAQAETERKERRDDAKAAAAEKKAAEKGFWSNTDEGRARDLLIKGRTDPEWLKDPKNAVAYGEAHNYLSQPRVAQGPGGTMIQLPKLENIDDYPTPGAAPASSSPTAKGTAPAKPAVPEADQVIENPPGAPIGSRRGVNPTNPREVITEFPDGSAVVTDKVTGNEIRREGPPKVDATAQNKLINEKVAADKIDRTATDFLAEWKSATPGQRLKALLGGTTPLGAAWAALMAEMKGEQQYNLGVLQGPDLGIIQRAISNPASITSLITDEKELERIIAKIPAGAQAAVKKREELMKPPSRLPKAGGSGGKRKVRQWNAEKNEFEDVEVD